VLREERPALGHRVAGVALAHGHLMGLAVGARAGERQLLAHGPEGQQADAELTLEAGYALVLEPALDGVADVRGDVLEVRRAVLVARDAVAVVGDAQVMRAVLAPAGDGDVPGLGVYAVLDELRDGF